jgi:Cu+-exporting ATPase
MTSTVLDDDGAIMQRQCARPSGAEITEPCVRPTIGREGAPMPNMKDPVCKMDVDPARAAAQSTYKSVTYYFCCVGCKRSFDREPEKYLTT